MDIKFKASTVLLQLQPAYITIIYNYGLGVKRQQLRVSCGDMKEEERRRRGRKRRGEGGGRERKKGVRPGTHDPVSSGVFARVPGPARHPETYRIPLLLPLSLVALPRVCFDLV